MPRPSSWTLSTAVLPLRATLTLIDPPGGVLRLAPQPLAADARQQQEVEQHHCRDAEQHLNVGKMRLLAKPRKMPSMTGFDLEVTGYVEQPRERRAS